MLKPFQQRAYLLLYLVFWIFIAVLHAAILIFHSSVQVLPATIDSLIFNGLYTGIGWGFWYSLRFNSGSFQENWQFFLGHALAAVLVVSIWLSVSYILLSYIILEDFEYQNTLQNSLTWRAITGIFYYAFIHLIFSLLIYQENLQARVQREAELKSKIQEAELNALRSQINPHFLFNSLNSISLLTLTSPNSAQEMIIKLSDFLRYSLNTKHLKITSLDNELEQINRYLAIEKIRFAERLDYRQELGENVAQATIPIMILQPLFENAIKYGVYSRISLTTIEFCVKRVGNFLQIKLSNEYDEADLPPHGSGIGLKNINKRLELLYHEPNLLKVTKQNSNFLVSLLIPQKKKT